MKRRTLLCLVAILTLFSLSCSLVERFAQKAQETVEPTVEPSATPQPAATPTSGAQVEAPKPAAPEDKDTGTRPGDGMAMIRIPAGEFLMGAEEGLALPNEKPEHAVYLDEYWIDQTEVTNAQYRLCAVAGACSEPFSWGDAAYAADDRPVVGVRWADADAYCQWAGARLPTEAEWEKAARGTDDRPYPWGTARPDGSQANMSGEDDPYEQTAPVGSFPIGASPYGVLDMTGNAREWVADWYAEGYYAQSPRENPTGPESGEMGMRVSRGGSFAEGPHHSRCTDRMPQKPDYQPQAAPFTLGFRCAASAPPSGEAAQTQVAQATPVPTPTPKEHAEPTPTPTEQAAPEQASGPVEVVSPDNLQSYRAEWTTRMQWPDQEAMVMQYKLEWVKEPPARHIWMDMAMSAFAEAIWVDDKIYVKVGDNWVVGEAEEAEQAFENLHDAFETDDDMALVGEETVNGVPCKHYVYDFESPNQSITMHREMWVADRGDLPEVAMRALFRMENKSSQGTLITEIEANLYDINVPIEIKPPI